MTDHAEKQGFWRELVASRPPQIRFEDGVRRAISSGVGSLDHVEFMMVLMEHHPFFPFEGCTFGSEELDTRRALAYEILLRQLAHTRSVVANVNIRNRPGVGTAIRCMLELYALARFMHQEGKLRDRHLIEVLLCGQSFAPGGWYEIDQIWETEHRERTPPDVKEFLQSLFGVPRVKKFLRPLSGDDEGFSFLYARYSEYVHPAFGRPRTEIDNELGHSGISVFGSKQYYDTAISTGARISLLKHDIDAASFCLQLFWPLALRIDPFFDDSLKAGVLEKLKEQGFEPPAAP